MQRNALIGIAIVILLALAGVWFSIPSPKPVTEVASTSTTPTVASVPSNPPAVKPAAVVGGGNTYKSLLTQKGNYQCDYNQVAADGQSQNVIYISGGKLRAEFRTMKSGQAVANLSVYDGRYLYEWPEGTTVGTRKLLTSLSELPAAIPKDLTSGAVVGTNQNSVGWNCHPWLVDTKLLVAPSYVIFK